MIKYISAICLAVFTTCALSACVVQTHYKQIPWGHAKEQQAEPVVTPEAEPAPTAEPTAIIKEGCKSGNCRCC